MRRSRQEFYTVDDVRRFNERSGHYFFEPATLRFFKSRIGQFLYGSRYRGRYQGHYFTTSEQGPSGPRAYTVR